METPRKTPPASESNVANDLSRTFTSRLFGSFWPQTSEQVGGFLFDAACALGMREADLARSLGVSKATLSGWKARAVIPAVHAKWFAEEFAVAVLSGNQLNKMLDSRHAGIPAVFRVFQQTDFNPFGLEFDNSDQAIDVCEFYFGGLCRLALFIQNRLDLGDQVVMEMGLEKRTASLLWQMALAVRPRLAFRYGSRPPS